MELLAAILAGMLGTVAMTLSSGSEMHWTGRGESPAPGVAAVWPLKLVRISHSSPPSRGDVGLLGVFPGGSNARRLGIQSPVRVRRLDATTLLLVPKGAAHADALRGHSGPPRR